LNNGIVIAPSEKCGQGEGIRQEEEDEEGPSSRGADAEPTIQQVQAKINAKSKRKSLTRDEEARGSRKGGRASEHFG